MKDRSEIGIVAATTRYEAWLSERIPLVKPDLELKHHAMSAGIFPFLRATFYRWAARWRALVGDVAAAPTVLAVGDLHVENFGTWRDAEGRLVWGVNDFDEAWPLPYTNDLVRLATSALVAREYHDLKIDGKEAVGQFSTATGRRSSKGDTRSCWRSITPRCARWRCIACTIRSLFGTSSSRFRRCNPPSPPPCWPRSDGPSPSADSRRGSFIASPDSGAWGASGSSRSPRGVGGGSRGRPRHSLPWPRRSIMTRSCAAAFAVPIRASGWTVSGSCGGSRRTARASS